MNKNKGPNSNGLFKSLFKNFIFLSSNLSSNLIFKPLNSL